MHVGVPLSVVSFTEDGKNFICGNACSYGLSDKCAWRTKTDRKLCCGFLHNFILFLLFLVGVSRKKKVSFAQVVKS